MLLLRQVNVHRFGNEDCNIGIRKEIIEKSLDFSMLHNIQNNRQDLGQNLTKQINTGHTVKLYEIFLRKFSSITSNADQQYYLFSNLCKVAGR